MVTNYPKISVIIPTLNAENVLTNCLISIRQQNYPQHKIEILICDGGSSDNTLTISRKYLCRIISNPLKTAEAGKAIGLKNASGKYIALIDSDNILPDRNWLTKSIAPLEESDVVFGSEPWEYTYRKEGGFIERYSALTGVNDPYVLIAGNFDRQNILSKNWTNIPISIKDSKNYQLVTFNRSDILPTIGANGTVYRKSMLDKLSSQHYLIDVDILSQAIRYYKTIQFAKTKQGIIHTFCESSILKFSRKQNRRVTDLYTFENNRPRGFVNSQLISNVKFTLYVILIIPMLYHTMLGLIRKPDSAWLFHPIACIITLYFYGIGTIKYKLGILKPLNRQNWRQ